jgi:hypothetical protein
MRISFARKLQTTNKKLDNRSVGHDFPSRILCYRVYITLPSYIFGISTKPANVMKGDICNAGSNWKILAFDILKMYLSIINILQFL